MARYTRMEVLNTVLNSGLIPLFYHVSVETALGVVSACARGGARVVEFTNRGEQAYPVFAELARRAHVEMPDAILGVGSVVDAPTAALFIASGANFIVGPNFDPEVARLCNRRKIAYIPGCATETEIARAEEWGAEICKIFPGNVGGPEFIKAVLAPCPWHRLMPTGGVDATEESIGAWIRAGAAAVGLGSRLVTAHVLQGGEFGSLERQVRQVLQWIASARGATG